jgi:tRNA(fMet)-specific endonuclease VapC
MLKYLVDTDICIYIMNNRPPEIAEKLKKLTYGSIGMSVITLGELSAGAQKSKRRKDALSTIELLKNSIEILDMKTSVANIFGHIKTHLELKGKIIGVNDLWIASHALDLELTVVTNNTREFSRVPKLKIENWAE